MAQPQHALARTVLEIAAEVERDERRIKHEILEAAGRGDLAAVIRIVRRWLEVPVREVLALAVERPGTGAVGT
jgi:hypothetical protein